MTARSRNDAILDVIHLVHEIDAGRVRLPRPGAGPPRVDGRVVVERAVHRVVCGSSVVHRLDPVEGFPDLVECHGCGLVHAADEVERHRVELEPPVPLDERDDWPPCERDTGQRPRRPRRVGGGEVVPMPRQRWAR